MAEQNLALISFDGVHLLLPQGGVATIETTDSIDRQASAAGSLGTLRSGGGEWPVYALASDFKPRTECPPSYKYCVAINRNNEAAFSLLCEEVGTVSVVNEDDIQPLQACMRGERNPIESLLLKDDKLMLVSDIEAMQHYLLPEAAA
jgi:chemotaxis signal transduction protein